MRKVVALIVILGLMALTAWAGLAYLHTQMAKPLKVETPVIYEVKAGDSASVLIRDFDTKGYLPTSLFTNRIWLKFFAGDTAIKAGTYQLSHEYSLPEIIRRMAAGEEYQFDVGLIEGLTLAQWLTILQSHSAITYDINAETLNTLMKQWPYAPSQGLRNAEGLFLADTYYFTQGTLASVILKRAMDAMAEYLNTAWLQRDSGSPVSDPYEALILASIIEKETAVEAERPHIAGVFTNRINKNMRLQTDPTVIYGLGENFDGNLTRAHLKGKTPYNTYVIRGLPPTPIAMAGRAAIDAALHPLPTDDLYFVSRGDGSHKFSATLEEHNQAVYEFQIKPNQKK